jgi:hypothetical protein
MKTVLPFIRRSASSVLTAQVNTPDSDANQSTPAPQPVPPYHRPLSLGRIAPFACRVLPMKTGRDSRTAENLASFRKSSEYRLNMNQRVRLCGEIDLPFHPRVSR